MSFIPGDYTVTEGFVLLKSLSAGTLTSDIVDGGVVKEETFSKGAVLLNILGVGAGDLPALVNDADYAAGKVAANAASSVGDNVVASSNKAAKKYTDNVAKTKVSKAEFYSKMAQVGGDSSALASRISANEQAIAVINGNTTGSISKAVADAKETIDAYTINGKTISTSPTLGANDIKVAGYTAAEDSTLSLSANSTITEAVEAIDAAIVATNAEVALKANASNVYTKAQIEGITLNGETIGNDLAIILDGSEIAITGYTAATGSNISLTATSKVSAAITAIDAELVALDSAIDTINGTGTGSISKAVSDAKSTIDAYTVNGKAISTSPTLGGSDIAISGFTAATGSSLNGITATSTVTEAISKIDSVIATINGGTATAGSIEKALKDAKEYADTKVSNLGSVFSYKGTKDTLAAVQAVANPSVGDVWHVANAGTHGTGAEYVCTEVSGTTGLGTWEELGTAVDLSAYATQTEAQGYVSDAKETIDAYTINGKTISTSPTLGGNDIAITGFTAATGSSLTGITASSTVTATFEKIDSVIATINGTGTGSISKAVADAKSTIDAYTVNGKTVSANPTLDGSDIALTGFSGGTAAVGLAAADTINGAFAKVETAVAATNAAKANVRSVLLSGTKTLELPNSYFAKTAFTATLPANPAAGDTVVIDVLVAAADQIVTDGTTTWVLSVDGNGQLLGSDTYKFVFDGTNWNVL